MSGQSPAVLGDQHLVDFHNNLSATLANSHITSEQITHEEEMARLQNVDTADMVAQVQRQIRSVEAKMQMVQHGKSGGVGAADSLVLQALEIERTHLLREVLPYTQNRAADIERIKASTPNAGQKLEAEAERRQRLELAAIKRAEELEVEEMAQRLRGQRRHNGSA